MSKFKYAFYFLILLVSCKSNQLSGKIENTVEENSKQIIKIAFGSCNKHDVTNVFWDDILSYQPDIFIWGGDNIYADTDDIVKLKAMYKAQNAIPAYAKLKENVTITGVWDDHDYGLNDGGVEFAAKKESQEAFYDFMGLAKNDEWRKKEGTYSTVSIQKDLGEVKILNLDTRYFRSSLKQSKVEGKRYEADNDPSKTILGDAQWKWLESELTNSTAEFNILVSSIQFLSSEHGFEKWANFPKEVEKLKDIIKKSEAKGVIILSGDRHISEFSVDNSFANPLVDFTSSGLTHAYTSFTSEPNRYRVGKVISTTSYGIVELNLKSKEVVFKIMGDNEQLLGQYKQMY